MNGKQIEKYEDNFTNGLHQPTFHEEGLHKPMEVTGTSITCSSAMNLVAKH